jgi:hypothetical protein
VPRCLRAIERTPAVLVLRSNSQRPLQSPTGAVEECQAAAEIRSHNSPHGQTWFRVVVAVALVHT